MKVFLNGKFVSEKEAKISAFDHGFLYGDGIYETLRTYHGKIWQVEKHLQRLEQSAKLTSFILPWSRKKMVEWLEKLVKMNGFKESRIRITVTRGVNDFDFLSCRKPTLMMTAQELKPEPKEVYTKGVSVILVRLQRVFPEAKTTSLFSMVLARQAMAKHKAYEALYVDDRGYATEGTVTNFFIVKNGVLLTPKRNILIGTTRSVILDSAKKLSIKAREVDLKVRDVMEADEIFITNAPKGIVPVCSITNDELRITNNGVASRRVLKAPGAVTRRVMEGFAKLTSGYF